MFLFQSFYFLLIATVLCITAFAAVLMILCGVELIVDWIRTI